MLLSFVSWLEEHQLPCMYQKYLGIPCPGCGFQRSFVLLLKGDFAGSFMAYPPLLPVLSLFLFLFLQLVYKFEKGGTYLKYFFIFTISFLIIHYIIKLI